MTIPCLSFQKLKPINLRGFTSGFQSIWFQVVPFFEAIVAAKNFKSCRAIENLFLCLEKRWVVSEWVIKITLREIPKNFSVKPYWRKLCFLCSYFHSIQEWPTSNNLTTIFRHGVEVSLFDLTNFARWLALPGSYISWKLHVQENPRYLKISSVPLIA